jgi:hypothetical protein
MGRDRDDLLPVARSVATCFTSTLPDNAEASLEASRAVLDLKLAIDEVRV